MSSILCRNEIDSLERFQRTQGNIINIADGCGNNVKYAL
jgi:hypothetical protein